jgi:TolB-like protein/Flp pilus assembly protein TadD
LHSAVPAAGSRRPSSGRRRVAALLLGAAIVTGGFLLYSAWRPKATETTALTPIRALAVLPFANVSGDPAQEYFAEGFTDELTTTLADFSALKVIARTSAASYKGTDKRAARIGQELGVDGLISGSVLRSGDRVRITAQLVSTETETNLWAKSYERGTGDVLALQAEVARAIANAIAVRLSPEETARLAAPSAVDPRALDAYLRGRALWKQRTETAVREGLTHFATSTRIAPEFALAFAGLADSYIILGVYGFEPPRQAFPAAKSAAQHAIELDPRAGEPHASLGDILFHYDWDFAASDRELRTAIELSPNFATAHHWRSEALLLTGRPDEAIEALRRARSLDPLSMVIRATLGQTLSVTGDRDGAIAELREAVQLDPRFPGTRSQLARELLAAGRAEEALAEARQVVETNPDHLPGRGLLGLCLAATGHTTEARQILSELDGESERRFVSSLDRARVTAGLRDGEATLRYLEEAVDAREGSLPFLPTFHEFDFLQGNPRYAAILERIGVPANLRRQP